MKKLCICLLAASLMVLGGGLPSAYAGQGGATINGDVNCSGNLDLSDAVYMLNYLFLGGDRVDLTYIGPGAGAEEPYGLQSVPVWDSATSSLLRVLLQDARLECSQ